MLSNVNALTLKNQSIINTRITILFSGVGKTCLIKRYLGNVEHASPTIGASFFTCKINLDDARIKLQVIFKKIIFLYVFL